MARPDPPQALIVGGGIGGLAAAIALRRVGLRVRVFERVDALAEAGAGLTLWPNAISALGKLGLSDTLASVGQRVTHSRILSWRGDTLADTPVGLLERRFGAPMMGCHRAELQSALLAALGPEDLTTSAEGVGFEQDTAGVRLRLAGGEVVTGDVLIGADGIHSMVRGRLFGKRSPRYAGYTAWRGIARLPARMWPAETASEIWGEGKRFGLVPLPGDRVYWFGTMNASEGGRDQPGGRKRELLNVFRGWHEPVLATIEATDEAAILRNDIYDRPPLPHWSEGRVTLLGDAAHPMTPNMGQGACQAIEDAVALAERLAEAADVAEALKAYEARRLKRANAIVRQSLRIGQVAQWEQPWAASARNFALKMTPTALVARQLSWALRPA